MNVPNEKLRLMFIAILGILALQILLAGFGINLIGPRSRESKPYDRILWKTCSGSCCIMGRWPRRASSPWDLRSALRWYP